MAHTIPSDASVSAVGERSSVTSRLSAIAPDLIFALLVIINSVRLLRHAMWRDEVQAFMLSAASSTPLDLFAKLKDEGHPGLWQLLLWLITRFTTDPISMQVAHLLVALGIWLLIWRASPFKQYEKLLLLLELLPVLGILHSQSELCDRRSTRLRFRRSLRCTGPRWFWPWVLLGLLANTSVFATIWSFGLAGLFAVRNRTEWRALLPGATIYRRAKTLLAIATIMPRARRQPSRDASFRHRSAGYRGSLRHRRFLSACLALRCRYANLYWRLGREACPRVN